MPRNRGFTLIEIAISVGIMMVILLLAIPSVRGVLADRRLQRSLTAVNDLVHQAQERSVQERRPYLLVWEKKAIVLRPEATDKENADAGIAQLTLQKGESIALKLPAALEKEVLPQWIFWPSGTCEPANLTYTGPAGLWEANYAPLTAQPQVVRYATR